MLSEYIWLLSKGDSHKFRLLVLRAKGNNHLVQEYYRAFPSQCWIRWKFWSQELLFALPVEDVIFNNLNVFKFYLFLQDEKGAFIASATWALFSLLLLFLFIPQDVLTQVRWCVTGKCVINNRGLLQYFPKVRQISPCKYKWLKIWRQTCF